jgi:WD40 repeat protein
MAAALATRRLSSKQQDGLEGEQPRSRVGSKDSMRFDSKQKAAADEEARFLVGQVSGRLDVVGVMTGELLRPLEGHTAWISKVDVHWPTQRALSAGGDGRLMLWDLESGEGTEFKAPPGGGSSSSRASCVRALAVNWGDDAGPMAGRAVSGCDAGRLELWDIHLALRERLFKFNLGMIGALVVDWHFGRALVGHGDDGLDLVSLGEDGNLLQRFFGHSCLVGAIDADWQKDMAVCGSGDASLIVWDLRLDRKGAKLRSLRGHRNGITGISVMWEGNPTIAVSCSEDKSVRIWAVRRGECIKIVPMSMPVRAVSVDFNTGLAVCSSVAGEFKIFEAETGASDVVSVVAPELLVAEGSAISLRPMNYAMASKAKRRLKKSAAAAKQTRTGSKVRVAEGPTE